MLRWTSIRRAWMLPALLTARYQFVIALNQSLRALKYSGVAVIAATTLQLGGCGGGGGGGGGSSGGAAPSLVVSGSVSAPSGQVAFNSEQGYLTQLVYLVIARADAALTGIVPVADGTVVELVRIDHLGNVLTTLATTTTAGGKYSFNLSSRGLAPASDLAIQVVNTATAARMRAFVTSESVNLDPVSETVFRMVLENIAAAPGATLANLTVDELNDIIAAADIVASLSSASAGVNIDSTVAAIKAELSAKPELLAFLGSAIIAGQTNDALGDIGNYFPIVQDKPMVYEGTFSFNGSAPTPFGSPQMYRVTGTKTVGGTEVSVFTQSDQFNPVLGELYYRKTQHALEFHGDNDPFDPLTAALVPYDEMHFPLRRGSSYEQLRKNNLDSGSDLDEDGVNERVNIVSVVSVEEVDGPVTVPSGTYENVMKVETRVTFTFRSSAFGDTVTVFGTDTNWLAPGVGSIKFSYEISSPEDGESQIETWVLTPKQHIGPEPPAVSRVAIVPSLIPLIVGGTQTVRAWAYDENDQIISGFPLAWASSNEDVVQIEGPGRTDDERIVRGMAIGTASITASLGGVSSPPLTVTVAEVRILPLATNDIEYDPGTARIYASVPGRAGNIGNSVVAIDPALGTIGTAVWVGSEPNRMALSDDGRYLYIGLDGEGAVRRFTIASQIPGLLVSLGSDATFGQMIAGDIEVLPGAPDSFAVARHYTNVSPSAAGVAIYDNATKRVGEAPRFAETGIEINNIEFSATSSRLYGGYGADFARMPVTAQGITATDVTESFVTGPNFEFDASAIYALYGLVFDPEALRNLGTFPLSGYVAYSVLPNSATGRVYFLTERSDPYLSGTIIEVFDAQRFTPIGSIGLPGIVGSSGCGDLVRWGTDGLAFRCARRFPSDYTQDYVILIRSDLVR